jgi:hypothetical protein
VAVRVTDVVDEPEVVVDDDDDADELGVVVVVESDPAEAVGVVDVRRGAALGVTVAAVRLRVWKVRTASSPARVMPRTIGARLILRDGVDIRR